MVVGGNRGCDFSVYVQKNIFGMQNLKIFQFNKRKERERDKEAVREPSNE